MTTPAEAPAPAAGPPKTAKRDGLRTMEKEMQAKWNAAKSFEVDAPKVSCIYLFFLFYFGCAEEGVGGGKENAARETLVVDSRKKSSKS